MSDSNERTSFLNLPGELRNKVYRHYFEFMKIKRGIDSPLVMAAQMKNCEGLFLANKQIYTESRSFFFGSFLPTCRYHFWQSWSFRQVVQQVPPEYWSCFHGEFEFDDDKRGFVPRILLLIAQELGFDNIDSLYDEENGGYYDWDRMRKARVRMYAIDEDGVQPLRISWGLNRDGNEEQFIRIMGHPTRLKCFGEMILLLPSENPYVANTSSGWTSLDRRCVVS